MADKAAVLAFRLARAHPLIEANKRTATVAMLPFADRNGHDVTMSDRDLEEAIVAGAAGHLTQQQFVDLVAPTIRPKPPPPRGTASKVAAEPRATYQADPTRRRRL